MSAWERLLLGLLKFKYDGFFVTAILFRGFDGFLVFNDLEVILFRPVFLLITLCTVFVFLFFALFTITFFFFSAGTLL